MRILAVAPKSASLPIGIACVIAAWKQAGHHVDAINLSLVPDWEVRKGDYDFVATGGLACHYSGLREILEKARAAGIPTILGGGIVTSEPKLIATALRPDYCVLGEGEEGAVELLAALQAGEDPARVAGIAFFRDGAFVMTEPRKAIKNLDLLPAPDLDALGYAALLDQMKPSESYDMDLFDYPRVYPLMGSRSCPYNCSFCYHPLGKKYRQRSIDSIMEELARVIPKYRINIIGILDELFAVQGERLREFCQRLRELLATIPWEVRWGCQLRVDHLSDEIFKMLQESGCYLISYGLESASPTVLASMKKRTAPEQIERAIEMTFSHGIGIQANFIFGDRAETPETAEETLAFWRRHAGAGIFLGFIHPYPNSELYQYCVEKGIIKDRIDFLENHLADRINMTAMSDYQFFLLVARTGMHTLLYPPCASPSVLAADRLVVRCPHCGENNDYRNYRVFDPQSSALRRWANRSLLNRVLHCRCCHKRFWGRRRLFRLGTVLARPLVWSGIFQVVFGSLYLTQKTLPAIRRKLSSGTLDKRNS